MQDKVVIITGGCGNLGTDFCKYLSDVGGKVVCFDRKISNRISGVEYVEIDITKKRDVVQASQEVINKFGQIDVLVNNACLNPAVESGDFQQHFLPPEKYALELWNKEIEVGLTGMMIVTQAVAADMMRQKKGSIINISSIYGLLGADHRIYEENQFKSIAYSTLKGALVNFGRSWASRLGAYGVRVNTLTLGGVYNVKNPPAEDFVRKYSNKTMLGRMASASDYRGAMVFLASDASSYMTGSNLIIDGGWSAW